MTNIFSPDKEDMPASTCQNSVKPEELLRNMFNEAIASAQPALRIPSFLPSPEEVGNGRLIVIGAGKASAAMAQAVERNWAGPLSGLVVTRYGYAVPCDRIEIVEAAHPVPDQSGQLAAERILALVQNLRAEDWVLCLISGGGSALMPIPLAGLTLEDKQSICRALLKSGASISEINCVRRHLSAIKGGRLAAACYPAHVVTLLISDVPGDNPIDIASGPTVADPTSCAEAMEIVRRYGIELPEAARRLLETQEGESIKPDDVRLRSISTQIIATPGSALRAAARVATNAGLDVHILSDAIEGEARDVGKVHAAIALQCVEHAQPFRPPCVLLSGGETTVTVRGWGRGGRNVEFLLSLAIALNGKGNIHALAGDTDGVDGVEEVAGAFITPSTVSTAWALGINPRTCLDNNEGHSFFEAVNSQVITGPTLTNVNDFRAVLILN